MEIFTLIIGIIVSLLVGIPLIKWYSKEDFKTLDEMYNSSNDIRIIDSEVKSGEIADIVTGLYDSSIDYNRLKSQIKKLLDE
jgi:translation initiation factor 1 (eIF-1/SUI1)